MESVRCGWGGPAFSRSLRWLCRPQLTPLIVPCTSSLRKGGLAQSWVRRFQNTLRGLSSSGWTAVDAVGTIRRPRHVEAAFLPAAGVLVAGGSKLKVPRALLLAEGSPPPPQRLSTLGACLCKHMSQHLWPAEDESEAPEAPSGWLRRSPRPRPSVRPFFLHCLPSAVPRSPPVHDLCLKICFPRALPLI